MAIELSKRTKILAGVVVLVVAGAGAWFFYLQDLFDEAPPAKVAATSPATSAPKSAAPAVKPAADASKPDAPKGAAAVPPLEAPKQAEALKPAAAAPGAKVDDKSAAKPAAAKPIPTNPDQLIAEVIEASGIKSQFQSFSRETLLKAGSSEQAKRQAADPEQFKAVNAMLERVFEPGKLTAELTASLKGGLNAERMTRFLELLRQPIAIKMNAPELRNIPPEAIAEYSENFRKSPPPAARVKLVQTLDDVTHNSELAAELATSIARNMVDTMLAEMQKSGKNVPKEARQMVGSQLNAMRDQARSRIRTIMYIMYRDASEQELSEYAKLLDTDTGRWGWELLANAVRPILVERGSALGKEVAQFALAKRAGAMAKAPAAEAPEPLPKAQPAPAAVATARAAPAEQAGYQRPKNIRPLYSRYNDLITATVMRDRAAVKELLDDGKGPNARQADGMTPLMIAVSNGDADIAGMLLAKGADPSLRATGGVTALSLAKARGASGAELVQLLQRNGAKN
jgi:hypothetical protein